MMKNLLLSPLLTLLLPVAAQASSWTVDPSHSNADFSVKHMMVTDVRGMLGPISGKLELDDKDITKSTIEVSIDVASITTRDDKRDAHLKTPDFFDTAKFPTMTFKSTAVKKGKGKGTLSVTGDLTMRGVTKPVTVEVEGPSDEVKDPYGKLPPRLPTAPRRSTARTSA